MSEIEFQDYSECQLIDVTGSDARIAAAAWVCTEQEAKQKENDKPGSIKGLINYMMKHRHGSPFEHGMFSFLIKAPIFVWREFHRHRIGFSYNEESARYKTLDPLFYVANPFRPMMKIDSWVPARPKFEFAPIDIVNQVNDNLKHSYQFAYKNYIDNLDLGVDPGLARDCLPVGIFSSCWVTCNPRSLMHFLSLRTFNPLATFLSYPLYEIEQLAKKMEACLSLFMPFTYETFNENGRVAP